MFQICLCGTQPGYQHAADCPYPLYRCTEKEEDKWEDARKAKAADLTARATVWTTEEILNREG